MTIKEKAKDIWSKHKTKIIAGAAIITVGTIGYVITRKCKASTSDNSRVIDPVALNALFAKDEVIKKKVDISGLEYDVLFGNLKESLRLENLAGFCTKEVPVIAIHSDNPFWMSDNRVLRHELMHAFFNRSGLENYSNDERLVDWLAHELPAHTKSLPAIRLCGVGRRKI